MIPYLRASYRWSSALVSTSSGFRLSRGIDGSCAMVFVQQDINTSLGCSVYSSTCKRLCSSFLPATREPLERSDGRHLQPFMFICSARLGPVSPLLCQSDESNTPYRIVPSSFSASSIRSAKSVAVTFEHYNSLYTTSCSDGDTAIHKTPV